MAKEEKAKKASDSYSARLVDGVGSELKFQAKTKNGKTESYVFYRPAKGSDGKRPRGKRGVTQTHTDLTAAKSAIDSLVNKQLAAGWGKPARFGAVRPDEFDVRSIPAPRK